MTRIKEFEGLPIEEIEQRLRARASAENWSRQKLSQSIYYWKNRDKILAYHDEYHQKNAALLSARASAWQEKNKERVYAEHRTWHRAHKESQNQKSREYYQAHRTERLEKQRKYYLAHKTKVLAYVRAYERVHPCYQKTARKNRRNWLLKSETHFTRDEFEALCIVTGNKCLRCGKTNVKLTADHVVPLSLGGSDDISNIQPLCCSCNSSKRATVADYRVTNG